MPAWRSDGREIYYINPAGQMMAAPVRAPGPTSFEAGTPVVLFQTRIYRGVTINQYDVARDGRFLVNTVLDDAAAIITVIVNWKPEAEKP